MSETSTEHVNGTAPAPAETASCEDCPSPGEKILAVLTFLFAAGLIAMAFDMFSGGKVSGWVAERVPQ